MVLVALAAVCPLSPFHPPARGQAPPAPEVPAGSGRFHLDVGTGQRYAHLAWSLRARTGISELTYSDVRIPEVAARAWVRLAGGEKGHRLLLLLEARQGTVTGGTAADSDIRYESRGGGLRSRSVSQLTGSGAVGLGAGVGWSYAPAAEGGPLDQATFWFGSRRDRIGLRKQHGAQVFPVGLPDDRFEGLDSRYRARWKGLWGGASAIGSLGSATLSTHVRVLFRTDFRAEGVWNLRDDLAQSPSFVQTADSRGERPRGLAGGIGVRVPLRGELSLVGAFQFHREVLLGGRDRGFRVRRHRFEGPVHGSSSSVPEIAWRSVSWRVGLSRPF